METVNMITMLEEMMDMQNKLNTYTCGENWKGGICDKTGKEINWIYAIQVELGEYLVSFDFKHWKKGEDDIDNAKMELVDVWHFMLSHYLYKDDCKEFVYTMDRFKFKEENVGEDVSNSLASVDLQVNLIKGNVYGSLISFFNLCRNVDMDFEELYKIYIVKNVLNKFRQDNGYKDGSYIKIWDGEEDNVVAMKLMGVCNTPMELSRELESLYNRL